MRKNLTFFQRIVALILLALAFGFTAAKAESLSKPASARIAQLELRIVTLEAEIAKILQTEKANSATQAANSPGQGTSQHGKTIALVILLVTLASAVIFSAPIR